MKKFLSFLILIPLLFANAGSIGSIRTFDGDTDPNLSAADSNNLDLGASFTIEAWVIPGPGNTTGHIVAKFTGGAGGRCYRLPYTGTALQLITSAVCDNPVTTSTANVVLPVGKCSHVAVTKNGATDVTFYVNGNVIAVNAAIDNPGNGTNAFRIGNANDLDSPFTGTIDEVRMWNVVRTADQIRDNMNRELRGDEAGLVAYYKLNRDANSSLRPPQDNLTINNSVPFLTQSCLNGDSNASLF